LNGDNWSRGRVRSKDKARVGMVACKVKARVRMYCWIEGLWRSNRLDWSSCTACYRYARLGSGRIPYYGKRAAAPGHDDVTDTPDDVIECCAETGSPECCRHVSISLPARSSSSLASHWHRPLDGHRRNILHPGPSTGSTESHGSVQSYRYTDPTARRSLDWTSGDMHGFNRGAAAPGEIP